MRSQPSPQCDLWQQRHRYLRCGRHVVGGGVKVDDPINAFVVDDYPDAANTAWTGRVANAGAAAVGFTVYAVCITVSTTG